MHVLRKRLQVLKMPNDPRAPIINTVIVEPASCHSTYAKRSLACGVVQALI